MLRRQRGEVVDRFVDAGGEAGGSDVVAEDAAIDDLCKECGLRNQFADEVRNIFLAFWRERFLIAGPAAKGDDYDLSFFGSERRM